MAAFEVTWTDSALLRFQNILGYYIDRNQSSNYSIWLQDEVERILLIVESFPKIGKLATDGRTRIVVIGKFELLYEIMDELIVVVDFWDPRQSPHTRFDLEQ